MSFLGKNRQLLSLLLIVFILTGLASISARENFAQTFVERWIQFAVAPLQRATSYFVTKWQDLVQLIKDFGSLREENERLKLELENIQYKLNNMIENTLERDRLRNLLQYATAEKALDLVLARVIARDVTAWQSELIIDRGTQHGLNKGDPVVTHLGAVGRVVEVSTTTSKILVITDPRSAVA
ncbi:MAG: rod shape-determining protein MreC, partial [bacterium]|nr:rod shape-determining protein MreC [bacterium]